MSDKEEDQTQQPQKPRSAFPSLTRRDSSYQGIKGTHEHHPRENKYQLLQRDIKHQQAHQQKYQKPQQEKYEQPQHGRHRNVEQKPVLDDTGLVAPPNSSSVRPVPPHLAGPWRQREDAPSLRPEETRQLSPLSPRRGSHYRTTRSSAPASSTVSHRDDYNLRHQEPGRRHGSPLLQQQEQSVQAQAQAQSPHLQRFSRDTRASKSHSRSPPRESEKLNAIHAQQEMARQEQVRQDMALYQEQAIQHACQQELARQETEALRRVCRAQKQQDMKNQQPQIPLSPTFRFDRFTRVGPPSRSHSRSPVRDRTLDQSRSPLLQHRYNRRENTGPRQVAYQYQPLPHPLSQTLNQPASQAAHLYQQQQGQAQWLAYQYPPVMQAQPGSFHQATTYYPLSPQYPSQYYYYQYPTQYYQQEPSQHPSVAPLVVHPQPSEQQQPSPRHQDQNGHSQHQHLGTCNVVSITARNRV
ncbi:hypothetical protein BG015_003915 [Linnemannia schmuckeri]|uniref:Uncharacterized protein n=1 Tax=Linnemannia schmuckeri TaxID=64567 RepID=A0A9P5V2D2_9FUNG|nr:hypothetical protein BG015_003915 [Linnemannia schmuckeri]